MKKMIQILIMIFLLPVMAMPAFAFFESSHLVLVVYNETDNEVAVDLGDMETMPLDAQNHELAAAGSVYITPPNGKSSQFGTGIKEWEDLSAAYFTVYKASNVYHFLFVTKKGTAPKINSAAKANFANGSTAAHTSWSEFGTRVAIRPSAHLSSYNNRLNNGAPGQMAGYNPYSYADADIDLSPLDTAAGYVDSYLYEFDINGNLVPGTKGDYKAVLRFSSNGSVILNPSGGNVPPTVELKQNSTVLGSTVSVNEGETVTINIEAQDENGDTITLTFPLVSQLPQGATLPLTPVVSGGTYRWTFNWTPASNQSGTFPLTFSVSDGSASSSKQLSIEVTDVNHPPAVSVTGSDTVNEGQEMTLVIQATDDDGNSLSLADATLTNLPEGAVLPSTPVISGGTYQWTFTWTPDSSQAGTYPINFTVTDGTSPVTVARTLTVANTNQQPELDVIQAGFTLLDPTTELTISINAMDEEKAGLALQYQPVSHASLPGTANVSTPVVNLQTGAHAWTFRWTPGPGIADVYTIDFSVRETAGETPLTSRTRQVVITVGDETNAPPVLQTIGPKETVEAVEVMIQPAATDPENQDLTYSVIFPADMPAGHNGQLNESTGAFTWVPQAGDGHDASRTYLLTFRVTDSGAPARSDEEIVAVTVHANQVPGDPSLNSPADGGLVGSIQGVELSVNNASDPDASLGQVLQYQFHLFSGQAMTPDVLLSETDPYLAEEPGTTKWEIPVVLAENQTYYWQCRVFDGIAYSQWVDGSFSVNSGNEPPGQPTQIAPLNDAVMKTVTPELKIQNAVDPDGDTLKYVFQVGSSQNIESSSDFQTSTVDQGNNHSGTGNTSWIVTLQDNTQYWWRVKAQDSSLAESNWIGPFSFSIDLTSDGPTAPKLDSNLSDKSIYNGEVTTDRPKLIVANAADPDADDSLTYFFEIIERSGSGCGVYDGDTLLESPGIPEGQMEEPLPGDGSDWGTIAGGGLPQDPDRTAWRTLALNDNTHYCWRVRAKDEQGNIGPFVESSFFVNLENDLPTACTIKSPLQSSKVGERMPILEVKPASDIDGDRISYEFILKNESETETYTQIMQGKTSWQVPVSLSDGVWHWQVKTFDEHANAQGEPSRWSEKAKFTVDINDLPGKPAIHSPTNKQTVTTVLPVLIVNNAVDQDGDALSYEFELYNDQSLAGYSFIVSQTIAEGSGITAWTVLKPLTDGMTYYWRVRSFDGEYHSGWTPTSEFRVNTAGGTLINIEASQQILSSAEGDQIVEVLIEDSPIFGVRVEVPAGALAENITLTIGYAQNPPLSNGYKVIGRVLEFGPSGTIFLKPVTIQIPYTQEDLDAAGASSPDQLKIFNYNEDTDLWEEITVLSVDQANRKIICSVDHFSLYFLGRSADDENQPAAVSDDSSGGGSCFILASDHDDRKTDVRSNLLHAAVLMIMFSALALCMSLYMRNRKQWK
ncbi:MAG: Ig-like domain-containing protein [Pseudomonadota bacterium]